MDTSYLQLLEHAFIFCIPNPNPNPRVTSHRLISRNRAASIRIFQLILVMLFDFVRLALLLYCKMLIWVLVVLSTRVVSINRRKR